MKVSKKKNRIIDIIIIFIILCGTIWIALENRDETNIEEEKNEINQETNDTENNITKSDNIKKKQKQYQKAEVIKTYNGYKVTAKLEIPAIDLKTYVLENYSTNALNVSVTKFWGAEPNQEGNFCIAGHNFIRKNMFRNLKKLKNGDKLYILDNKIGKVEYEIYNIFKVDPKDTSCLSQETNGKKEVTLITCTNDSKKRIIVKAKELEK